MGEITSSGCLFFVGGARGVEDVPMEGFRVDMVFLIPLGCFFVLRTLVISTIAVVAERDRSCITDRGGGE